MTIGRLIDKKVEKGFDGKGYLLSFSKVPERDEGGEPVLDGVEHHHTTVRRKTARKTFQKIFRHSRADKIFYKDISH